MKLLIFVVVLVHSCVADDVVVHNGEFYEYDTTRNGWYIGAPTNPIMVNLRQQRYHGIPDKYYDFANRTFARQPTGICTKEVP